MNRQLSTGLVSLGAVMLGAAAWLDGQGQDTNALFVALAGGLLVAVGALLRGPMLGALAASTYGAVLSGVLAVQHHSALRGGQSACNVNDVFNCDLVNTSRFSEVGGVPIALLGLGWFAAVAVVSALGWRKVEGYSRAAGLVTVAGGLGVGVAALLALASLSLGAWCVLCIGTYAAHAVVLVGGLRARGEGDVGAALMGSKDRSIATALVVGLGALYLGWNRYAAMDTPLVPSAASTEEGPLDPKDLGQLYEQPAGPIALAGDEPAWGLPDAPLTLVEFADYQCPYCAMMAKELKRIAAAAPELRLVYKHYPLSNLCNSQIPSRGHDQSCAASAAAVCAQQQGRFWEMNDQMFANQEVLDGENITFIARQLGLDMTAFAGCLTTPATTERVKRDVAHGHDAQVHSTPSLYVRGLLADPSAWVRVTSGGEGLELLLQARREGLQLPPAGPPGSTERE